MKMDMGMEMGMDMGMDMRVRNRKIRDSAAHRAERSSMQRACRRCCNI
jgi:membrane protease subunit (stomatin/prohibitin family)